MKSEHQDHPDDTNIIENRVRQLSLSYAISVGIAIITGLCLGFIATVVFTLVLWVIRL